MSSTIPTTLHKITADPLMQSRFDGTDPERVAEYAQLMIEGTVFPPVECLWDKETLWLWDGFTRLAAAKEAGLDSIDINMTSGTKREAWIKSRGANAHHGLNLTIADKRAIVASLLADPELAELSSRTLAKICNVSHTFIDNMRPKTGDEETAKARPDTKPSKEKVEKGGNVATPATTNSAGEEVSKVAELEERNAILADDHERMVDRLAVVAMEGTEEEKAVAADTIASLRQRVKVLEAESAAVKASRDSAVRESNELKKALGAAQRKIDKLLGGK